MDEDASLGGGSGLKEMGNGKLYGESSPLEVASLVAGNIENLMLSLASMEHKLKVAEERKNEEEKKSINSLGGLSESGGREADAKDNGDEVMNRRIGKYAYCAFPRWIALPMIAPIEKSLFCWLRVFVK